MNIPVIIQRQVCGRRLRSACRAGSTGAGRDFDVFSQFLVQVVEKTVEIPQLPRDPHDKSLTCPLLSTTGAYGPDMQKVVAVRRP